MSFIGNVPAEAYSPVAKDTFSGNGSTTDFTLSIPATTNGVEVFVENVQQEPTDAYTISGTTLSFTAAPVSGTDNIYVIHRGPAVQQVVPPAGVALSPSTVTATGDISTEGDLKVEVASGGIYTITGTDTASNRTLTLPDEAGTVVTTAGASFTSDVSTTAQFSTNAQGSTSDPAYGITSGSIGVNGMYVPAANSLAFVGGATERMRIDSSGNVLVGQTTSNFGAKGIRLRGDVGQMTATRDGGAPIGLNRLTSDGAILDFSKGGSGVGSISVTAAATAYNTSSDYRLKEDWVPMEQSIDRVKALKPVNFAWKVDGSRVDGFLAHEAQEVVPEAVTGTKDAMRTEEYEVTPAILDEDGNVVTEAVMGEREVPDYQGIDQAKLVPLLTAALQEAIGRIETLEAEVAALKETP